MPPAGDRPRRPPLLVDIRPARLSDVPRLIELYLGQSEESRRLYHPFPFDRTRLRAIFTYFVATRRLLPRMIHHERIHAAVLLVACLPGSKRPIGYGNTAFVHPNGPEPHAFFGYLVAPEYQSRGIGAQLHDALVYEALALGVRKGGGIIVTDNVANVRLVQKLGLRPQESDIVDRNAPGAASYRVDIDLGELMARRESELARDPRKRPVADPTVAPPPMPPVSRRRSAAVGGAVAIAALLLVAALLGVPPFRPSPAPAASVLYVGTSAPFPPFDEYNATTGTYSGFDIAYASMVAAATHRSLVVENYANLSGLIAAVAAGQVDLAGSALAVNVSNASALGSGVEVSVPYRNAGQSVLTLSSSALACPGGNCTPTELRNLTLGVMAGRASDTWVRNQVVPMMPSAGQQVHHYLAVGTEIDALLDGAVDAVVIDEDVANQLVATSAGQLHIAGGTQIAEVYCFALPAGDPLGLLPVVNTVIVDAQQNGTYARLSAQWFG